MGESTPVQSPAPPTTPVASVTQEDTGAPVTEETGSASKKVEGWMATVKSYLPHLGIASVLAAVTCWFFPKSSSSSSFSELSTASKCGIGVGLAGVTAIGGALAYRAMRQKEESDSIADESIETAKAASVGSKKRKAKTKPQEDSSTSYEIFLIGGALCLVGLLVAF